MSLACSSSTELEIIFYLPVLLDHWLSSLLGYTLDFLWGTLKILPPGSHPVKF